MTVTCVKDPGSFRDPSGFVFSVDGVIYRQINAGFEVNYDLLMRSGLYDALVKDEALVEHQEVGLTVPGAPPAYKVIRPRRVPFISYPYEWCFGQLKAAALLTLSLQRKALEAGLVLRDASAYNIQFVGVRPVFIDSLSFGPYEEGEPWVAYRQFCQHFLAPLALASTIDPELIQLLRSHIDGIPLPLASRTLPYSTRLRPGLFTHLHLHGRAISRRSGDVAQKEGPKRRGVRKLALLALVDSLERTVAGLSCKDGGTVWADYYDHTNYSSRAEESKKRLVSEFLEQIRHAGPLESVWDLGANTGVFSRLAAEAGAYVVAFDFDHGAVERLFRASSASRDEQVLPLVQNLANPSGGVGWNAAERKPLRERGPADAVLALAVVHHLAIGDNVPLGRVAAFLRPLGRHLIVEFVPKRDSQVVRMLASREDIFADYHEDEFERAFEREYRILRREPVEDSERSLYLMAAR